jgi:hypothetical protein
VPSGLIQGGGRPCSVTVAKLDGDDNLDVAGANCNSDDVTVLVGDGGGHFRPAAGSPISAGDGPKAIQHADFNGDDKADLAVANIESKDVTILLGNGSAGFSAAPGSPVKIGHSPGRLASADLNGDGRVDLVVPGSPNSVTVLLGDGTGRFNPAAASPLAIGGRYGPQAVDVADFNRDAKPDLAVSTTDPKQIAILLGDGGGGFRTSTTVRARLLAVADFNGDGNADVAVTGLAPLKITVLLGTGSGRFIPAPGSLRGNVAYGDSVAVADFDNDRNLDLALAGFDSAMPVLLGNGRGDFRPAVDSPFSLPSSSFGRGAIAAADLNHDGRADLAVSIRRSFQRGGEHGLAILWQAPPAPASVPGGSFPGPRDAFFSTRPPITHLAADGNRAAVATARVKSCGPISIFVWTASRRKAKRFNAGCGGDGVSEIALGGGQVAWLEEGGGNSLELTVTAARLSGGKPKQIDYDGNGDRAGGDPRGGWLGQLLGGGSLLAYNGWTITCVVPDGYTCDEYEPSVTVTRQRLVRIMARRKVVVKRGRASYPLAAVGGERMAVESAGAVNVLAPNGSRVATLPPANENPPRAIALSRTRLAVLRTFTLDLYDPATGSATKSVALGPAAMLQLAGVNARLALLRGRHRLVLVRLSDGRLISIALRSKTYVDAKLTSAGLFCAYNVPRARKKGRIVFEPTSKLLARF